MIEVYGFKNWSKRTNSTKTPNETEEKEIVSVLLKDNTSVTNPTILYQTTTQNDRPEWTYVYIPSFGAYYFVDNIISVRARQWEIYMSMDALGTYKPWILETTAYVEYSSSRYNEYIVDNRYINTTETEIAKTVVNARNLDSYGSIFLLHTGGDGDTVGGMCDVSNFERPYFKTLVKNLNDLYTNEEASTQIKRIYNSPFNAFLGAYWLPVEHGAFGEEANLIFLGDYYIATGQKVDLYTIGLGGGPITIPHIYNDFRASSFCDYFLYLPGCGVVQLPSDIMAQNKEILLMSSMDFLGNISYIVSVGVQTQIIGSYSGSMSVSLPLAQASVGNGQNRVTSAFDIAKNALITIGGAVMTPTNPLMGLGAMVGGLAGLATNSVVAANAGRETSVMTKGSIGGSGISASNWTQFFLTCVAHKTATSGVAPILGRPLMSNAKLGELTGYVKCMGASVDCPAIDTVRTAINNMLQGGIYIE